jgi:hypothetical protein
MCLSYWRDLGSPNLVPSTTMLKAFDGRSLKPHGIITAFPFELGGKIVSVKVKVVDAPLD